MRAEAVIQVAGARLDVGRQGPSVGLRVVGEGGEGLLVCATPEQARRLATALMRQATLVQLYAPDQRTPLAPVVAPDPSPEIA